MIQTLALTRLMPPMKGVFRHDLASAPTDRVFVVNGFLERDTPPRAGATCLFAGVSGPYERQNLYVRWLQRSPWPVGARDPATASRLKELGINAELVGCATLTLPRYDGPRSGIYCVDHEGTGTPITHNILRTLPVADQWDLANALLETYRTAEAVYTSRLHVALPCLAFGTPVWLKRADRRVFPSRFSLLEDLGVRLETLAVADVAPWAERYRGFLQRHLGIPIEPGPPKRIQLVGADCLRWRDRLRFRREDMQWSLGMRLGALRSGGGS
jgi:hypothetical protein